MMKKKILLIEDDSDARLLLRKILTAAGYEVKDHVSGNQLVNMDGELADLYILDHGMPTIDGVALIKYLKVKARTRNVPVLMVSGNCDISKKALKAGAAAFIKKPFYIPDFLETVNHLVNNASPFAMDGVSRHESRK